MIADSVRLALPAEASEIAAIQRRAWAQQLPADVAWSVLRGIDADSMATSWHAAIVRPPLATLRVLVAIGGARVAGFAAVGPSTDPDAESSDGLIAEFVIDPAAQRRGHGSRLLNACIDTMRADGFSRATWWVRSVDDIVRVFATGAGWAADGSHSEVGSEDDRTRLKLVRLHTSIG